MVAFPEERAGLRACRSWQTDWKRVVPPEPGLRLVAAQRRESRLRDRRESRAAPGSKSLLLTNPLQLTDHQSRRRGWPSRFAELLPHRLFSRSELSRARDRDLSRAQGAACLHIRE